MLRTVDDARACARAARPARRAVVVGSGFIGCEAAASLARRGARGDARRDEELPQARAPRRAGRRRIRAGCEAASRSALGASVEAIEPRWHMSAGRGGEALPADLVAARTGVAPRASSRPPPASTIEDGARARRRARCAARTRRARRRRRRRAPQNAPPGGACASSTGATRCPGRGRRPHAGRRGRRVGRRARLLVDDRRPHAQVRGVGRRLRRGARGGRGRRRTSSWLRRDGDDASACSPTSATRTTSGRGGELEAGRAAAALRAVRRRARPRRGGAHRRLHRARWPRSAASRATPTRSSSCSTAAPTRRRARARRRAGDLRLHVIERPPPASAPPAGGHGPRLRAAAGRRRARRPDRHHRRRLRGRARLAAAQLEAVARAPGDRRRGRSVDGPRRRRRRAPRASRAAARAARRCPGAASTTSSAARRSRSPPPPTAASAASSRAPRSRTRASRARCAAHGVPIARLAAVRVRDLAAPRRPRPAASRATSRSTRGWSATPTAAATSRSAAARRQDRDRVGRPARPRGGGTIGADPRRAAPLRRGRR